LPTILSHPAVPLALGLGVGRECIPTRLLVVGMAASIVPDLDVIGLHLGVAFGSPLGHRGFTHSLAFAGFLGVTALLAHRWLGGSRLKAFAFVTLSAASHGLLDMFTNGGRGVAIFWPFSQVRFFFPWRPIEVSPLSLERILSARGAQVLASELIWIWLPVGLVCCALWAVRRLSRPHA
jgi:inner membrane protein